MKVNLEKERITNCWVMPLGVQGLGMVMDASTGQKLACLIQNFELKKWEFHFSNSNFVLGGIIGNNRPTTNPSYPP